MTMTGNAITDREAEIATLEAREAEADAPAPRRCARTPSSPPLSEARDATVTSLAQSRFDWERVLRELALVIPDDVWLTAGNRHREPERRPRGRDRRSPAATRSPGPALELVGCGAEHDAVAGFVAALATSTASPGSASRAPSAPRRPRDTSIAADAARAGDDGDCRTRDFIAKFEIVAAFDAVPAPAAAAPARPPHRPRRRHGRRRAAEAEDSAAEQTGEASRPRTWSRGWRDEVQRPHDPARHARGRPGRGALVPASSRRSARRLTSSTTRSRRSRTRSPSRSSSPLRRAGEGRLQARLPPASSCSARRSPATTTRRA